MFGAGDTRSDLRYTDDGPLLILPHAAVRLWMPGSAASPGSSPLDLQWITLP
jgi:hypothetical protein